MLFPTGCAQTKYDKEALVYLYKDSRLSLSERDDIIDDIEGMERILQNTVTKDYVDFEALEKIKKEVHSRKIGRTECSFKLREAIASNDISHLQFGISDEESYEYIIPLHFTWFSEGLILTGTDEEHKEYLGMKLTSFSGLSLEEAIDKYSRLYFYETESGKKYVMERFFWESHLQYLDMLNENGSVTVTLEANNKDKYIIDVFPVLDSELEFVSSFDLEKAPKYFQNQSAGLNYCYEGYEALKLMIFRYFSCSEDNSYTFEDCFTDMLDAMEDIEINTLVFDVRNNNGGNRMIAQGVLDKYKDELRDKEKVILFNGNSYSAAVQFIEDCLQIFGEDIKFIGEETGQKLKNLTEIQSVSLDSLHSTMYYPTARDYLPLLNKRDHDSGHGVLPSIFLLESYEDFLNGEDTFVKNWTVK